MLPHKQIEIRLQQAVRAVLPDLSRRSAAEADAITSTVLVRPCPDPKFGDYQCNALMSLAKARKSNPRQLATDVLAKLDVSEICEKVEIVGAGFLNFRLKPIALAQTLQAATRGEHLFFDRAAQPRTVVIDFSSPNVAKPMHVGHIRSTILGDCLARALRLLGHRVITDNHIGDWGTQFGMLLVGWSIASLCGESVEDTADPIAELEKWYKLIHAASRGEKAALEELEPKLKNSSFTEKLFEPDAVLNWARNELVRLQRNEGHQQQIWNAIRKVSQKQFDEIYSRLGVKFDHTLGESFYNPRLQPLVEELVAKGIARESEGAMVIFFDDVPPLKAQPLIIRKSDGGFNYATTDLATLEFRLDSWKPDEIIYVTDGRQQLHFQQVFAAFRKWQSATSEGRVAQVPGTKSKSEQGLAELVPPKNVKLAHAWFGSILGEDGKPFKTRSGETVKLADLLDEAEERAFKIVSAKNPELPEAQRREIARVVGLGAVKYADLLPNRQSDYVFCWDKMLALQGNTAPYLQYAYTRIWSIFRKAEERMQNAEIILAAPEEIALAKRLLNFGLTLEAVAEEYRPNFLCNYLFELAGKFTAFYENCPVLKADDATRASRLTLCDLTARVLKQGLETLGIETVEQM
jgi:arginyl-tRNA synthetase